jgi:DNA-directed RNA polymerase specialized sigma subunit
LNPTNEQPETEPTVRGETHTRDGKELRKIWDKYRESGDAEARGELTDFYFGMVQANSDNIARIVVEAIEENDLYQAGVVAFFEALNDFDPSEGFTFEDFGSLAIRRAIVDEIRMLVGTEADEI